jgi:ribonuclease I
MAFTSKDDINILQPSDSAVVGAGTGNDVYILALDWFGKFKCNSQ